MIPLYHWLGPEADETMCILETYEQLCVEAGLIDLTDPQCDE